MTDAINNIVINGVPRQNSIYIMLNDLTTGILERRPNASNIPRGKAKTIPTKARANVRSKPPHWLASDSGIPKIPPPH